MEGHHRRNRGQRPSIPPSSPSLPELAKPLLSMPSRLAPRSLVFANERVHLIDFEKLRSIKTRAELDAHQPLELLLDGTPTATEQEIQDLTAPWRVSCALLAEPLRLYFQTVQVMPPAREAIDEAVGASPPVFHLGGDGGDPEDTEYQFVEERRAVICRCVSCRCEYKRARDHDPSARIEFYRGSPRARRGRSPASPMAWRMKKRLTGGISLTAARPTSRIRRSP